MGVSPLLLSGKESFCKGFHHHSSRKGKRTFHSNSFTGDPHLPTCSQFLINFLHSSVFLPLHGLPLTASSLSNLLVSKISGVPSQAALPARHGRGPLLPCPVGAGRGGGTSSPAGPVCRRRKPNFLPLPFPAPQSQVLSVDQHTIGKAWKFKKNSFFRTVCKGRT